MWSCLLSAVFLNYAFMLWLRNPALQFLTLSKLQRFLARSAQKLKLLLHILLATSLSMLMNVGMLHIWGGSWHFVAPKDPPPVPPLFVRQSPMAAPLQPPWSQGRWQQHKCLLLLPVPLLARSGKHITPQNCLAATKLQSNPAAHLGSEVRGSSGITDTGDAYLPLSHMECIVPQTCLTAVRVEGEL